MPRRAVEIALACATLVGAASAGCASRDDAHDAGVPAAAGGEGGALAGAVSCLDDPRIDSYGAGLAKPGANGALTFVLQASDPAPPAKGANLFTVVVNDAEGAPQDGVLTVDLFMPDHGHGTSVPPAVSLDEASGTYMIDPVYLFMPGVWRIELGYSASSSAGAEPIDHVALYFCVEG
jgi:hypothetical protein